jgi:hypothetical protein
MKVPIPQNVSYPESSTNYKRTYNNNNNNNNNNNKHLIEDEETISVG